jgi:hypothetical protein
VALKTVQFSFFKKIHVKFKKRLEFSMLEFFCQFFLICFCFIASQSFAKDPKMEKEKTKLVSLDPSNWKQLKFSSLKPNTISGNSTELIISVNESSSPLIYKFESPIKLKQVDVYGEVLDGELNLTKKPQGLFENKKSVTDDFVLRFGLVLKGKSKKPPVPNFLLASWIKEMFSLAPKGVGVDKILFLNVTQFEDQVGQTRTHPLSDYLSEEFSTFCKKGAFKILKNFKNEVEILGLWISANGEGTKSKFKTKLTKIEFKNE